MRINHIAGVAGAYQQNATRKVTDARPANRPEKSDGVTLSREAQEALSLREKVAQAPEIRAERIEDLRRQIEAGTYRPSGRDVADKMLKAKLFDDVL